jgi:putative ABC transport system permease protein
MKKLSIRKLFHLNLFQFIGLRHVRLRPGRTLLTTLGVALGIALYVAISIINESTKNALKENVEAVAGKASLTVSAGIAGFAEEKLEVIRTVPGVKSAVPMIEARAFFEGAKESVDGLYVLGVDLLQEQSVRTYQATDQRIIDDPLTFLNQPDSIIFTEALAAKRGFKLDSKVKLSTANGLKTFTIRGLLKPEGTAKAFGGSLAIMDIDGARMMFGKENKLDRVDVVPQDGVSLDQLSANLQKALGDNFTIETPAAKSEQSVRMIAAYQLILTFFSTLALLVGLFLVMNSISVAIAERKKEIGTLRALGATRFSMTYLFVSEIFWIGLIGSTLGCLIGRGLAEKLVAQVTTSVGAQFQTRIEVTHLQFEWSQILTAIVFGTMASILAAFFPALKAAAIHPLESMKRHAESASKEEDRKSKLLILAGLALLIFNAVSMMNDWGKIWFGIDLFTKIASVLGSALFGPFLVFLLIHGARKIWKNTRRPVLKLALENLIRSRKRTTSNVMALMVGLFLVMLIASVRTSFHGTLTNWLNQIFVADLMVVSSGRAIMGDVQPMREEVLYDVLAVPGVRPIGQNRGAGNRIVPYLRNNKKMMIKAYDRYADFYEFKNFAIQNGEAKKIVPLIYSGEPTIIVSPGFLTNEQKKVGEKVELDTPSGRTSFRIVGEITDYGSPQGVIYLSRENYKKYWKDPLITAFVFNIDQGYTLEQVRSEIDRRIGQKWNLVTLSNAEFKGQMEQAVERSFAYTRAIELIALLVGLLGLLNTLLISVLERTREIGMLRAIGSTKEQISGMILYESLFQGVFGSMIAVLLGSIIGRLYVEYGLTSTLGWVIDFHFPKESVIQTLITGVIVAMLAGFYPSKRAGNLEITESLDYE